MRKILKILFVVVVLGLMWAALDDITTGSQRSFVGEWMVVIAGAVTLLAVWVRDRRKRKAKEIWPTGRDEDVEEMDDE